MSCHVMSKLDRGRINFLFIMFIAILMSVNTDHVVLIKFPTENWKNNPSSEISLCAVMSGYIRFM